jgi:hypothetical protein
MDKLKDMQGILEFNGIVRNYLKMKRIENRIELNEEIKLRSRVFKPVKVILEKSNMYRIFEVEVTRNYGNIIYKQLHELHLIELKKRANENNS